LRDPIVLAVLVEFQLMSDGPTYGQTDGHTMTAYIAIALRGKNGL